MKEKEKMEDGVNATEKEWKNEKNALGGEIKINKISKRAYKQKKRREREKCQIQGMKQKVGGRE